MHAGDIERRRPTVGLRADRRRAWIDGSPVTISMNGHGPSALGVTPDVSPGMISLRLSGEMDTASAGHLAEILLALPVDEFQRVQLDLSGLAFLDAAGLTALLQAKALIGARNGRLSLYGPSPMILRILAITGLTGTFDVDLDTLAPHDR